ncbi:nuclear transport factor 2 family protein [Spirosoma endbachense]|uniref:DUF4440 domain-containing protein n=1 Tax=Spirosoma endbachense TaxID=2666025 RepID=A0A6P1VVN3_9BACT|nr:nuclear transport factor 2 family protein [Spirosoma endbachense]QHV95910.1 DUF4440 domain-containing protein [Spirosoma endbachense]
MASKTGVKEVVSAFITALNNENFDEAHNWISDDLTFVGVLGTRQGGDTYIEDMKKMRLKYTIQKVFVDEQDVCLWYEIDMSGVKVLSSGWYQVENGKITQFKVLFDPRPVLEAAAKKS